MIAHNTYDISDINQKTQKWESMVQKVTRHERDKHDVKEEKTKDRYHNDQTLQIICIRVSGKEMGTSSLAPILIDAHASRIVALSAFHVRIHLPDFAG